MALRSFFQNKFSRGTHAQGKSIRAHVSLYFAVFGTAMVLGVVLVLLFTNNLVPNVHNISAALRMDSDKAAAEVRDHCGAVAAEAINLSKALTTDLEANLKIANASFINKQAFTAALPELLDLEIDLLLLALERADCSGVFLILNATVNPTLSGSETSRAGIYIQRLEPKRLGNPSEMLYLRGPTEPAIRRGMTLQVNWDLEFDVASCDFWQLPLQIAKEASEHKLVNLYFWTLGAVIPDSREPSLLCAVPLLASDGHVLGVCGFEITQTSFRAHNTVSSERYSELTISLTQLKNETLYLEHALFSGNRKIVPALRAAQTARLSNTQGLERVFIGEEGYRVAYTALSLYPNSSHFAGQRFAVTAILPESAYNQEIMTDIARCIAIFIGMLLLSFVLSYLLSRRMAKPFTEAAEAFKNQEALPDNELKVGIRELDELLRLYANPHSQPPARVGEMFADFLTRLTLLTPRERVIVARYAAGKTQEEIREEMVIAPSTLKTHNSNIYAKLGVRAFEELQLILGLIMRSDSRAQLEQLLESQ